MGRFFIGKLARPDHKVAELSLGVPAQETIKTLIEMLDVISNGAGAERTVIGYMKSLPQRVAARCCKLVLSNGPEEPRYGCTVAQSFLQRGDDVRNTRVILDRLAKR